MAQREAIPALTSIRGLAAWWVVFYHFTDALPHWVPGQALAFIRHGYLAVDLFFVLSGFVLALNYGERFRHGLVDTGKFYWLRFARIYPLHFVMLMLFLLNPLALVLFSSSSDVSDYSRDYFVMSIFLVQNWGFTSDLAWNVPAWSISTEVFAYLLFPIAVLLIGRWVRASAVAVSVMLTILVALALGAEWAGGSLGSDVPRFGLARCCLEFLLGVLLWRLRVLVGFSTPRVSSLALLFAAGLCLAYILLPLGDAILMPAAWTLLVFALADRQVICARLMDAGWLEALGLISYATYLTHFFIRSWVKFLLMRPGVPDEVILVVYVALVGVASVLLYRWVEVPGRFWLRGLTTRSRQTKQRTIDG